MANSAISALSIGAAKKTYTQNSHGFAAGDVLYYTGSVWAKAKADTEATAEVVGIIELVPTVNTFVLVTQGYITGLSGLVAGTTYFLSGTTAGALTSTEPTTSNYISKPILVALDSSVGVFINYRGSLITSSQSAQSGICNGRLTLQSGVAISTADQTAKTTVYFTPYNGNNISLFNGTSIWTEYTFTELSCALGTITASKNYDLFVWNNSETLTLSKGTVWTSDTARVSGSAGEVVLQDGVYVNKYADGSIPALKGRLVGTFYTTSTTTTEDSAAKRLVANAQNIVTKSVSIFDSTDSWNYTTAVWRQKRASTANQITVVVSLPGLCSVCLIEHAESSNPSVVNRSISIGEDSTSSPAATATRGNIQIQNAHDHNANLSSMPGIGYHYYAELEYSTATGTTTWYGDGGGTQIVSGMTGTVTV